MYWRTPHSAPHLSSFRFQGRKRANRQVCWIAPPLLELTNSQNQACSLYSTGVVSKYSLERQCQKRSTCRHQRAHRRMKFSLPSLGRRCYGRVYMARMWQRYQISYLHSQQHLLFLYLCREQSPRGGPTTGEMDFHPEFACWRQLVIFDTRAGSASDWRQTL